MGLWLVVSALLPLQGVGWLADAAVARASAGVIPPHPPRPAPGSPAPRPAAGAQPAWAVDPSVEKDALGFPMHVPFDPQGVGVGRDTVVCMVTAAVGVAAAVGIRWEWGKLPVVQSRVSRGAGRSYLLDNVKWFAQLLVVYSHLLGAMDWDLTTWLFGEREFIWAVRDALEVVLNPLFCVISGVLSQGAPTEGRLRRYVQFLVIPTVMVVYVVQPLCAALFGQFPLAMTIEGMLRPDLSPAYFTRCCPWYLLALVAWRGMVYLLWSQMRPEVAFAAMVAMSCAAGYVGGTNEMNWGGGWGAVLGYLPYFAAGYVMPFGALSEMIPKPGTGTAAAIAAGVWIYAFYVVPAVFGQALPDGHGNYMCCHPGAVSVLPGTLSPLDVTFFWTRRIARLAVEIPVVLTVIFGVLPRSETPLTYMGAHTLYSYVFHLCTSVHILRASLLMWLGVSVVEGRGTHVMILVLHIPYCLGVMLFLTSSYWRAIWSWAISPQWPALIFAEFSKSSEIREGQGMEFNAKAMRIQQ